jgi:hypothetical protein
MGKNYFSRMAPGVICLLLSMAAPVCAEVPTPDQSQQLFAATILPTSPEANSWLSVANPKDSSQEPQREWSGWPWRRAGLTDYVGSAIALAGTLYSESVYGNPKSAQWSAHNGFDESARDALRLNSSSARNAADTASDVLMGVMIAAPVLDSFATLGVREGRWDATWQTEMINLESFTFTGLACSVMGTTIKRERPFVRNCGNGNCADEAPNRSMPSGHEAFAFTGAGLLCTHHAYQSQNADSDTERAACAISLGLAATTGVLRIMSDRHYATDVAVGTLIGLFSGFALPRMLHYSWHSDSEPAPGRPRQESALVKQVIVAPQVVSGGAALKCDIKF